MAECCCNERRERPAGAWTLLETCEETSIALIDQTRNKEYEYRILARNKSGDDPPSNTLMAVL